MKNIMKFEDFSTLVWEPKRKPNDPRYMPKPAAQEDYKNAVREEIDSILTDTYQMDADGKAKINNMIWNVHLKDWYHILTDSMCNWDTPSNCAQKCIKFCQDDLQIFGGL